tara:strand:- start:752 stop:1024 length:273 start_codon:yes stop_codon:yes gene_type:complete
MTGEEVEKYIKEEFSREPMHDVDAISHAASEVAYLYSSSTTAEQVVEFMLADKPIPTLATHSYGFHTRSGRGLRELFTENYNSYKRNNGN